MKKHLLGVYREARSKKLCIACAHWDCIDGLHGICHEPNTNRKWATNALDACMIKPKKFKAHEGRFEMRYAKLQSYVSDCTLTSRSG